MAEQVLITEDFFPIATTTQTFGKASFTNTTTYIQKQQKKLKHEHSN